MMSGQDDVLRQSDIDAFLAAKRPCLCVRHNAEEAYSIWYATSKRPDELFCLVIREQQPRHWHSRRFFRVVRSGSGWLWLVLAIPLPTMDLIIRDRFPDVLMEALL